MATKKRLIKKKQSKLLNETVDLVLRINIEVVPIEESVFALAQREKEINDILDSIKRRAELIELV